MYIFAYVKKCYIILFFQSSPNNNKSDQTICVLPYISILYMLLILSKSRRGRNRLKGIYIIILSYYHDYSQISINKNIFKQYISF